MFNVNKLWKKRFSNASKEMMRYLRYIFNGHLVVVMLFLLGTLAFYYQEWISTLTPQFPAAIIMTLILVLFVTYSPTYTFLLPADKIFLLPVETKLNSYFLRANIVSIIFQSYILLLLLAALMPMYVQVYEGSYGQFLNIFAVIVVVKSLNLFIRKYIFYYIDKTVHLIDFIVRLIINGICLYFLFSKANIIFVFTTIIILIGLYVFFRNDVKEKGVKWEILIEQEEKRKASFYRLANMFTDVPQLKEKVKRRKYLDILLKFIPFGTEHTANNLLMRTFIRSGDYLGLFIRLTVIGVIVVYFITNFWAQLFLILLFIYLTGFQLLPLRLHHQNNLFFELYPLEQNVKDQALKQLLNLVLIIQAVIFSLTCLFGGQLIEGLITLLMSISFVLIFVNFYSGKIADKKM